MSLFYSEAASIARETPKKQGRQTIALSVDQKRSLSCAQCPLDRAQLIHPKMAPTGADRPDFYFLGEAPGKDEDEQGVQFVGASGQLLRERIPSKYDKRIRWNNSIQCHPPSNRDPAPLEIECCRKRIVTDIEQTKPKVIVGFGNFPLSWITDASDLKITNWRGRRFPVKVGSHICWFYPITHPAAILRGQHDRKKGKAIVRCFERDLERVFADVEAGLPQPYVEQEKDYLTGVHCLQEYGQAGLKVIEEALAEYTDIEHSIDIETVGMRPYQTNPLILSIAVGDYDNVLAFPWQHPEARWTPRESATIKDIVHAYLLGKGKKWAHNCKFEQEWFVHRYGPEVMYETVWADTYGQAHVIDERKGKGLDELTLLYFGFRLKEYWMKRGLNVDAMDRIPLSTYPLSLVLPYNGTDVKYCFALKDQQTARLEELGLTHTYEFMNSTTPSLVMLQRKGVVRNVPAIIQLDKELTAQEEKQHKAIMNQREVVKFSSIHKFSPTSNPDLVVFFKDFLRIPAAKQSDGGGYSVDEEALAQIDHPIAKQVLELRSTVKNHGYVTPLLEGGKFVHADGMIHCSYNNYLTVSGRLCVAKGTPIEIARNLITTPELPIEQVRPGDWAYTYDNNGKLTLRRVVWVGQTGVKKVIRLNWISSGARWRGYVDLTPDHEVRLSSGKWIKAKNLKVGDSVLSMSRSKKHVDQIYATGWRQPKDEPRLVWEAVFGKIRETNEIHHKDHNHFNNTPTNLQEMTKGEHTQHHNLTRVYPHKDFPRISFLRAIAKVKGRWTRMSDENINKWMFRIRCDEYGINLKHISRRYTERGIYVSRGQAKRKIDELGVTGACRYFGADYTKWRMLLSDYQLSFSKRKPPGKAINNHIITAIKSLPIAVPVYDLEVEDTHNFIGGGICLHNSADTPNTQNYPRRAHKEIRRVIGCPPGHKFVAFDYGQLEWRLGAMLSRDRVMISELWDGKDIHGDWTDLIGGRFVPRKVKENRKKVRDSIKQYWTFANLYGNVLEAVARDLSYELGVEIIPQTLAPYFEQFWSRYPELRQYQDNLMNTYWKMGWVETGTGLRRHEPAGRNEISNHPLQGTAGHLVIEAQTRLAWQSYEQDRPSICPILNVHDDLSMYIPDNRLEEDIEYIAREMVTCPFKFAEGVPLTVECSVGDNWADKEEVATFSTADFDDIPF